MVKPTGLTNADMHDAGYLNVNRDLSVIAAHPHPAASPRQAQVRRYLQETIISAIGYRVIEQPFTFTMNLTPLARQIYLPQQKCDLDRSVCTICMKKTVGTVGTTPARPRHYWVCLFPPSYKS
ncbi:hypothetical protein V1481_20535, partial [Aeromonas enteropelogenes]|uniref:hypothetical protein n=1 Tax=Aeromonas enteropelogenes TaxID=29489 RepID=UPI003137132D